MHFNLFVTTASNSRPIQDLAMKKTIHLNQIDLNQVRLMSIRFLPPWLDDAGSVSQMKWTGSGNCASSHWFVWPIGISTIISPPATDSIWFSSKAGVPWPWPSKHEHVYKNGIAKSIIHEHVFARIHNNHIPYSLVLLKIHCHIKNIEAYCY